MAQANKTVKKVQFFQQNDMNQYGVEAATSNNREGSEPNKLQHEQMLKLIAKGFYKELISYGIDEKDVITVNLDLNLKGFSLKMLFWEIKSGTL